MPDPESPVDHTDSSGSLTSTFTFEVQTGGRAAVWVRTEGELDHAGSAGFEEALRRALDAARLLILDLRAMSRIDHAGAEAIHRVSDHARDRGRRLVIVRGPDPISPHLAAGEAAHRLEVVDPASILGGRPDSDGGGLGDRT